MKRTKLVLSLVAMLLPATALAQDPMAPEPAPMAEAPAAGGAMKLGVDIVPALPIGDLGDAAGFGVGGLVRFEYALQPALAITGRAGYIHHLEKNNITFSNIPIWGGVKYGLSDALFVAGEIGFNMLKTKVNIGGFSGSSSTNKIGLGGGVGYVMGDLELRAGINAYDLGEFAKSLTILGSVGYNFMAF